MTSATTLTPSDVTDRTAPTALGEHPKWVRPAVALLLAATAVLYLWNLSESGYGNSFYAMAVQAGTQSWKAWFFGSLDPGNIVTVDKPPASLWLMGLSGRIFGFSSWSMLIPDALAGIASVGLVYLTVRRTSGPAAGLLAGSVLALTPVAALMFRFNNPDAVLVLLLVAGAYCTVRAIETASTKWLLLAGVAVGFGFLDKMLQAFLVLPAFVLAYLVAAPTSFGRRVRQLFAAAGAVLVSAGWWVAAVALWPAADRPYIGGSTNNSALELALGYNGLGRILGGSGGGPAGGAGGARAAFGGQPGLSRMFGQSFGSEVSWLLPAALIALVAGLWFTRHAPRTDRTRAALLLWGGWTIVTAVVFSYMSGIIHPYYAVALAPGIAGLVGIAGVELWRGRGNFSARVALALVIASTGVWGFILLSRDASWQPWVRYATLVLSAVTVAAILFGADRLRRAAPAIALVALCGGLLAPAAFTVATAAIPHTGAVPTSGPVSGGGMGGGFGGPGGSQANSAVDALLSASTTKWAAATSGYQEAAGLALNTGKSVMAIGGFSGSDPAPTLAQFQQYVANGDIHYFVVGGNGGFGDRGSSGITTWVDSTFTAKTVGGATVYDLTAHA
jgi:4-amino-4-deoxy-L-arabinose transferase-like glycosyltransferase